MIIKFLRRGTVTSPWIFIVDGSTVEYENYPTPSTYPTIEQILDWLRKKIT